MRRWTSEPEESPLTGSQKRREYAMTKPDREAFLRKQRELCGSKGYPFFMPRDGYCGCGRDIVQGEMEDGNDGGMLVTGCPYCGKSYCE